MARIALARSYPLALTALAIIGFVSVLVSSVTSMALPALAHALGTSIGEIVWVTTAFLFAAGLALPAAGWAVDRFGGRPVLLVGLAVFAAGSLASGMAMSFEQLIVTRAVQGLGGGVLEPACLALVSQITDRRRIGTAMGLMSMVINIAPVLGPLVGATLLSTGSWRNIFWFALPPAMLAGMLLILSLRSARPQPARDESQTTTSRPVRLDLIGLILLGAGYAAALFAITQLSGGSLWGVLATGVFGVLLLVAYARRSLRISAPIIDPRLFTDRRFSGAVVIMGLGGLLLFSMLTLTPLMADQVWGLRGLSQAIPLSVFGAGMLVSMSSSGSLSDRIGPRPIVATGAFCTALALGILVLGIHLLSWPFWASMLVLGVSGLSFGAVSAPTFASIYRVLPAARVGAGTTAVLIGVQLSAALGVTGIGVLIDHLAVAAFTTVPLVLGGIMLVTAGIARQNLARRSTVLIEGDSSIPRL